MVEVTPLGLSVTETAVLTGRSKWAVREKLRKGLYRARNPGGGPSWITSR